MAFVQVQGNRAPVAVNDLASTDDRTSITINVLSNDTDEDNDSLTVTQASASAGSVQVNADNSLTYTPQSGFSGTDTISYTIDDGFGGQSQGTVSVSVQAFETVEINNSSGGSLHSLWLALLVFAGAYRRLNRAKALALLTLLLCSLSVQANPWYVEATVGSSRTDTNVSGVPANINVLSIDDTDTSFSIGLGYQFSNKTSLKVSYLDLGEGEARLQGETIDIIALQDSVTDINPVLADGITFGGNLTVWESSWLSAQLQAGLFFWDADIRSVAGDSRLNLSDDGTDVYWGGDIQFAINPVWSILVSYQRYQLDEPINNVALGVKYSF
jgi:hypothetical protein